MKGSTRYTPQFMLMVTKDAVRDIYEYIWGYYNTSRPHSANGYQTPGEVYKGSPIKEKEVA